MTRQEKKRRGLLKTKRFIYQMLCGILWILIQKKQLKKNHEYLMTLNNF